MTVMDDKREDMSRAPCYLLKLHMDMCTKKNPSIGSGDTGNECNAVLPCHYTWFTCQDTASYTKGERVFQICTREAAIPGCLPLLKKEVTHLPVKVNTDKFKTEVGELRLEFDNFPLSANDMSDPDKCIGNYSLFETEGAPFWPVWKARNKNYPGRKAEFYRGFVDVDPDDFELEFTGGIYDVSVTPKGANISVRSFLWETANKKFPSKISDSVTLTTSILASEVTNIEVDDGTGSYDGTAIFDVAKSSQPRVLKIEDEYITYALCGTQVGGTGFAGLTRGAFGTIAVNHAAGVKVEQVTVYAENDGDTWEGCSRVLADHCLMDLLLFYAKIPIDYIKTYDHSITLDGDITNSDTTIGVSSVANLPEYGIIRIDDEAIWYRGILGTNLIDCRRGQYGTTAVAHDGTVTPASVLVFGVTEALGNWHPGLSFKARFEDEDDVASRVETWRACAFANVWPGTDGKIDVSLQVPPIVDYSLTYSDDDIIQGTKKWTGNDKTRKSRVRVWHRPRKPDPKTSGTDKLEESYYGLAAYRDAEGENANVYGDVQLKIIYGEWIDTLDDAMWLAAHIFARLRQGVNTLEATLELKDDNLKLMDLVKLSVPEDVDADGNLQSIFYIVVSKVRDGWSKLKMIFEQAGFGGANRFAAIGPLNPVLDVTQDDNSDSEDEPIDIDLSGTTMVAADFASGGAHQIEIEDEEITYTTATDIGGDIVRLTGITRGVNGTGVVEHLAGVDVVMLYSAASTEAQRKYGWIGSDSVANLLDSDGDLTPDVVGYSIW